MDDFFSEDLNVGITFEDSVLKKNGGLFSNVHKYMKESEPNADKWMLSSETFVRANNLDCLPWLLHYFYDGHVVIWSTPSRRLSGPDSSCIRAISMALVDAGWKRPEPALHEIDANAFFWKQLWETGVVDSRQLTLTYGKRKIFGE
jgi:hypothetical protein